MADLGVQRWTDLAQRPPVLLAIPLGACEQHGPHLPLDTDTRLASALAEGLAARRPDVLVAPAIGVAASGEHAGFPGTLSIGTAVLTQVLIEVVRSADWAVGVVVVNGHGGNLGALRAAETVATSEGRAVLMWSPALPPDHGPAVDSHAGRVETSLMLALHPELVTPERPIGATEPLAHLMPELRRGGVRAVSASGVLGDAAGANPQQGRDLLDRWTRELVSHVERRWPLAQP